jgi:hypothetical protein
VVLALSLGLFACGGSAESKARELQQTRESWNATVQLTAELQRRGAVPSNYARQTLDAAQQELEKTRHKAQELSR